MTWFNDDELSPVQLRNETAYKLKNDPGEGTMGARGSVTDREATILSEYAHGKKVLEIGTGTGYSAFRMASTAASVTTVDVDPFVVASVFPRLEAMGVRCCTEVPEETFEMVFIDGDHSEASVTKDIERTLNKLQRPGKMLFHDTHFAGVNSALRKFELDAKRLGTALCLAVVEFNE